MTQLGQNLLGWDVVIRGIETLETLKIEDHLATKTGNADQSDQPDRTKQNMTELETAFQTVLPTPYSSDDEDELKETKKAKHRKKKSKKDKKKNHWSSSDKSSDSTDAKMTTMTDGSTSTD